MYDWVLNTPLEDVVQDAPREGLAIAPPKTQIFVGFLLIEEYEYVALRMVLLIATCVKHSKAITCW